MRTEMPVPPRRRPTDLDLSRRGVLRGAIGVAGAAGLGVFAFEGGAVAVETGARFLTASERRLLSAVVDRVVPGQPEDTAVGAVQVGCPEAIDALLAAFTEDPPRIFAGAPWSDRGGSPVNHFRDFLPLDPYEERAWRLRIEGSGGFQEVYRRGLAALARTQPLFATLPGPVRDVALRTTNDPDVQAMRDLAITHALEFFLAAPEYGGNQGLGGWDAVGFEGDRQPRGFTEEEVDHPEPAPLPLLPQSLSALLGGLTGSLLGAHTATVSGMLTRLTGGAETKPVAAAAPAYLLSTAEGVLGLGAAGTDQAAMQRAVGALLQPLTDPGSAQTEQLRLLHARAEQIAEEARG